jgi:hypothetical protein
MYKTGYFDTILAKCGFISTDLSYKSALLSLREIRPVVSALVRNENLIEEQTDCGAERQLDGET